MSPAWQAVCVAAAFCVVLRLCVVLSTRCFRRWLARRQHADLLLELELTAWFDGLRAVSASAAVAAQSMNELGNRFRALGAAMPAAHVIASTQPVERTIA